MSYGLNFVCPPAPTSYIEALIPNVMEFEDGKWYLAGHGVWDEGEAIMITLIRKDQRNSLSLSATWGHSEKAAICKPGREFSPETKPASTLILAFGGPELWEIKLRCYEPPGQWYCVSQSISSHSPFKTSICVPLKRKSIIHTAHQNLERARTSPRSALRKSK